MTKGRKVWVRSKVSVPHTANQPAMALVTIPTTIGQLELLDICQVIQKYFSLINL